MSIAAQTRTARSALSTTCARQATAQSAAFICFAIAAVMGGCNTSNPAAQSPYATQSEATRDPIAADRLCRQAANLIDTDPAQAEKLLREALACDLFHGPSHNNLGVILLNRGALYEASAEFEWARKLMPGSPDPRVNLALTLERAGRTPEAIDTYRAALESMPEHYPALLGLTRLELLTGTAGAATADQLKQIASRASSQGERDWARTQLLRLREDLR